MIGFAKRLMHFKIYILGALLPIRLYLSLAEQNTADVSRPRICQVRTVV